MLRVDILTQQIAKFMKKLKVKHYQYLLIALLIITVISAIGSFFYGKTYEYSFINNRLNEIPLNLQGLKIENDGTLKLSDFSCYPFRNDNNCSQKIIDNDRALNDALINHFKNNVQVVRPIIQSKPTVTNTNCYTDIMGLVTVGFD